MKEIILEKEKFKEKFKDKLKTTKGIDRAFVELNQLKTLWFNTGTLCNLECKNCYIESSPKNDRLSYLSVQDIIPYLNEIKTENYPTTLIGLTGGEPFLNPDIMPILEFILAQGFPLLVLTNANRVLKRHQEKLLALNEKYPRQLQLRVSLDHYTQEIHDKERGEGAFEKTIEQIKWLSESNFQLSIAGRSLFNENAEESQRGHQRLFEKINLNIESKSDLVIFPEMHCGRDVPEISVDCWSILNKKPEQQMCSSERMIVKRKGESRAVVMPCTLLAYDEQFILGDTLKGSEKRVYLNHKFCAEFCVLGGASCSLN